MNEVSLEQILHARDLRVQKQKDILSSAGHPIVSFTMNIAGPVKKTPLTERAFYEGIRLLKSELGESNIILQDTDVKITGCEAIFAVGLNATDIKEKCCKIEESTLLGRLFDMDVIDTKGKRYERKKQRGCIVCGAKGRGCASSRAHSVTELQDVTRKIIEDYFLKIDKENFSSMATECLLKEVYTTPKPGLVDLRNSGSHKDMDVRSFEKSAKALKPYFEKCFSLGTETSSLKAEDTFILLKEQGIRAEETMYNTTGGVNTHKGAIYSLGIILGAMGRLYNAENPSANYHRLYEEVSKMAKKTAMNELKENAGSTAGERIYQRYGIKGIRGEASSGFNSVSDISLPLYKKLLGDGLNSDYAGAVTLLHLIASVKDTNLYNRGGKDGAEYAVKITKELLTNSPLPSQKQIEMLDDCFIKRNLSPGGCADLLAITYFLYGLGL